MKSPKSLKEFVKDEDHFGNLSETPEVQDQVESQSYSMASTGSIDNIVDDILGIQEPEDVEP